MVRHRVLFTIGAETLTCLLFQLMGLLASHRTSTHLFFFFFSCVYRIHAVYAGLICEKKSGLYIDRTNLDAITQDSETHFYPLKILKTGKKLRNCPLILRY